MQLAAPLLHTTLLLPGPWHDPAPQSATDPVNATQALVACERSCVPSATQSLKLCPTPFECWVSQPLPQQEAVPHSQPLPLLPSQFAVPAAQPQLPQSAAQSTQLSPP